MKQLITRVDDELHARLKRRAEAERRSVNAIVVEALEQLTAQPSDARAAVRARARAAGLLVTRPSPTAPQPREQAIAATRGAGAAVSDRLLAERAAR